MTLTRSELMKVSGGAWYHWAALLAGGISFLIGVADGFFRPVACNS